MKEIKNVVTEGLTVQEESYKSGSVQYIDSREVAEMVEKDHDKLCRDIKRYIGQLDTAKIGDTDFFQASTYKDSCNRVQKCYLVTLKGCEFIAHKLTGQKGTEFTARYINRFHEMKDELAGDGSSVDALVNTMKEYMLCQEKRNEEQMEFNRRQTELIQRMMECLEKHPSREAQGEPINFRHDALKERMRTLGSLVDELAVDTGKTNEQVLRAIYLTIENRKGISLNAYKAVYVSESGEKDASMMKALVSYDWLYSLTVEMCRETLDACRMFRQKF